MKKNMGVCDRTFRTIAAVIIAVLFFTEIITGVLGIVLLVFALIMILTSIFGNCPIYPIMGINTCCKNKKCCGNDKEEVKENAKEE